MLYARTRRRDSPSRVVGSRRDARARRLRGVVQRRRSRRGATLLASAGVAAHARRSSGKQTACVNPRSRARFGSSRSSAVSPIAFSYVVVRLDDLIEARRLYRLSPLPANQRALFNCVEYGGQSTDTPDGRWDSHKQHKLGDRLLLLVTRYDGASALPANTRTIGEACVLDECALEHLKPLFVASGAFEADSGDRAARQLDDLGAPAFEAGSGNRAAWLLDNLRARYCE